MGAKFSNWLVDYIHERGPLTVAAFMDLALYDPEFGYYARAAQRSGRTGDFFTSVDVGPIFGELLARQIAEMDGLLGAPTSFDLVEAGAGNGRLSADILASLAASDPALLERLRLHLVEASPRAREAQAATLGIHAGRLISSSGELPQQYEGVLLANELLDAMPVHQVVMHEGGLRETYVVEEAGRLIAQDGPLSSPELESYLAALEVELEPGWRAEINLRARDWIAAAARRLTRGFVLLIDYGHPAATLYSASHSGGTLTTFRRHTITTERAGHSGPAWLADPGEQDITAHVDFTTIARVATANRLTTLGFMDQTYFLMGLLEREGGRELSARERRGAKTLIMPGGLGSTFKVMIFGKGVEAPLLGGSLGARVT